MVAVGGADNSSVHICILTLSPPMVFKILSYDFRFTIIIEKGGETTWLILGWVQQQYVPINFHDWVKKHICTLGGIF